MTATRASLRDDIDEIMPGVIADRRHLHQHPELGFQEVETSRFVTERLRQLGVEEIRTGIATTGVTGLIRGTKTGPRSNNVVMLRADMDALPIHEQNDVEYKSLHDGVMHACGHDAHTSMLLGISRILMDRRDEFSGTVKVLFQPAEEGGGGAKIMIDEGVMDDPAVDAVFGMHMDQDSPVGTIGYLAGPAGAASDRFELTIQGRGGHGARPSRCIDPIVVGSQIIVALQTVVAREVDPVLQAVVTIGSFRAGEAANVIPDTAEMRATVRSFDPGVREQLQERITAIVEGVATTLRAAVDLRYHLGYPPLINEPEMTELVRQVATETVGAEMVIHSKPQMGSEDFAYFLQRVPGSFFNVGTMNPEKGLIWGHHHPRFDIDEEGMSAGIATMVGVVMRYLNG